MKQNPYQAPIKNSPDATKGDDFSRVVDFRQLLIKWEKYRLVYNAALIATTLLGVFFSSEDSIGLGLFPVVIFGAIFANVMFMLGPSVDGYLQVAGLRHSGFGLFIFGCGTLFAVLMAASVVNGM